MYAGYQDRTLQCRDCGNDFMWTAGEQAFYASKGLTNVPARCPSCRAVARQNRQQTSAYPGRPRELFPAICNRCGGQAQVPFMPRNDRPVYCSTCYDAVRLERAQASSSMRSSW